MVPRFMPRFLGTQAADGVKDLYEGGSDMTEWAALDSELYRFPVAIRSVAYGRTRSE